MALTEQIQTQIVTAMKDKDTLRLNTLRSIKVALDKYVKDQGKTLDEAAEHKILETLAKQREESLIAFGNAGRTELAQIEKQERDIILSFLPQLASDDDVAAAVAAALAETGATTIKQMGAVLASVRGKLAGQRVNGATLAAQVKAKLT